jgi:hypothetical protein
MASPQSEFTICTGGMTMHGVSSHGYLAVCQVNLDRDNKKCRTGYAFRSTRVIIGLDTLFSIRE